MPYAIIDRTIFESRKYVLKMFLTVSTDLLENTRIALFFIIFLPSKFGQLWDRPTADKHVIPVILYE